MKTSEKDTPETNKAIFKYGCKSCGPIREEGVEPTFARKLERERDNLLKYVDDLWDSISDMVSQEDLDRLERLHPKK